MLPSTAKNGKISWIAPTLTLGSAVTTSKNDVNYVITEYGVAQLRGKSETRYHGKLSVELSVIFEIILVLSDDERY